ncbi:acyltransferase [Pelosinus baikalensis]|uniref:Acyltransferase family protein n=1 Tax=Pelosinus baikalensis TaxID=2892015 RepID=A0ABS8I0R3_9FIRM|nr:acyltransferase family protein [Pelosinus baikalensis]MCC5468188.1 acyltransferase family protein [Pelosinus baikalensis]
MKRNQSIELLRLISIFFIVIIHSTFAAHSGIARDAIAMDALARFAVPIFFMITGYFILQPNYTRIKFKKQIIKLTKYYIFYEFIYILYYFIIALLENKLPTFESDFITNMKYILIDPKFGFQLWYLINIIWALMIIYIFNYFNKLKILFIISIILNLIGVFISNLSMQLFHTILPIYMTRNFLLLGLFYIILGTYIRKVDINKIKFNNNIILAFSIFMCLSQVVERYLWRILFNSTFEEYFITTIFASISIFIFTLKSNVNNKIIEKISSYSMPIYFLHILVIDILGSLSFHILHININVIRANWVGNITFVIVVCIFSCILYDISKKMLQLLFVKVIKPVKVTAQLNFKSL